MIISFEEMKETDVIFSPMWSHTYIKFNKAKLINFSHNTWGQPNKNLKLKVQDCIHSNHIQNGNACLCPEVKKKKKSIKCLGVFIDENMKWHTIINYLYFRLKYIIYKYYKINKLKDIKIIRKIYQAYVDSLFQYCVEVWGGALDIHFNKIFSLQKYLIRAALDMPRFYFSELIFKELNGLTEC